MKCSPTVESRTWLTLLRAALLSIVLLSKNNLVYGCSSEGTTCATGECVCSDTLTAAEETSCSDLGADSIGCISCDNDNFRFCGDVSTCNSCSEGQCVCSDGLIDEGSCAGFGAGDDGCISCTFSDFCSDTSKCSEEGGGERRATRRLNLQHDDYLQVLDTCGDLEYDGAIYVNSHFFAVFYPSAATIHASCPMLAYQLRFDEDNWQVDSADQVEEDLAVEIIVDTYENIGHGERIFPRDQSFSTGTYTLNQVADAVASVQVPETGAWDVLHNSCFAMATQMAVALDWDIDNGMLPYVSQRLRMHHTSNNVQKAIKTRNFVKYFQGGYLEPVLLKTVEAWIGGDGGLGGAPEGQALLDFIINADPEEDEALAVFYDELVDSYVDRDVRTTKKN